MLDWKAQEFWEMSAGKMKGIDCRHDVERCTSISLDAETDIILERARSLQLGEAAFQFWVGAGRTNNTVAPVYAQAYKKSSALLVKHLRQHPISSAEMEAAIAREAVAAHRGGQLLISIAPDLTLDEAKQLLERQYRSSVSRVPGAKQRARWGNWLPLIDAFETDEALHGGTKSQVFNRYRRALDRIHFTQKRPLL